MSNNTPNPRQSYLLSVRPLLVILVLVTAFLVGRQDWPGQADIVTATGQPSPKPLVSQPPPTLTRFPSPTPTAAPATPIITPTATASPTPTPVPLVWQRIGAGVERTYVPVVIPNMDALAYVYALRFDPSRVVFQVHYEPGEARLIEEWQEETGAPIVVNSGFFASSNRPVGRIVIDGELYGSPLNYDYDSIGTPGVFAILDNVPEIYVLGRDASTYSPQGFRFDLAIECYPVLLLPGNQPAYPTETGKTARRTVIAIDHNGKVVLLLIDSPIFTLHQLSKWLAGSGLNLDIALNLDGGRSSGLVVSLGDEEKFVPSVVPLPIVLGIYPPG